MDANWSENYSDLRFMCESVTAKLTIFSILGTSQDSQQRSDWFTTFQWQATPSAVSMFRMHDLVWSASIVVFSAHRKVQI